MCIRDSLVARAELLEIAAKTELFPDWLGYSESKKVRLMERRFKISPRRNEFANAATGQDAVAFEVGYTDPSAQKAVIVANEFINRLENQDRQQTVKDASDTSEFFQNETERLTGLLRTKQQEIAEFKSQNNGSLPEQLPLHERQLERLISQSTDLDTQIRSLEENKRTIAVSYTHLTLPTKA